MTIMNNPKREETVDIKTYSYDKPQISSGAEIQDKEHAAIWYEVKSLKEHQLSRIKEEIDDLKEFTRENRRFFLERLDKLDARIWGIMVMSLTTLLGIIANFIID